jgi:hypothetical protein
MLRLTLPDSIADEARKTLDSYTVKQHVPVLVDIKLDPNAKF